MSISTVASEKQLQLEGASLTAIMTSDRDVRLCLVGADIHCENHLESHEAELVVSGASFTDDVSLPSEIVEASICVLGLGSRQVFIPLPFSVSGACQVELSLRSGDRVLVTGSSCHVELGPGTSHSYSLEPQNGT
jgi:hypothetical protein